MKTKEQKVNELLRDFFSQENRDLMGILNRFWDVLHNDFNTVINAFKDFSVRRFSLLREDPDFNFIEILPMIIDEIAAIKLDLVKKHCLFLKNLDQEQKKAEKN